MENLSDYSNYVIAAYIVASLSVSALMIVVLAQYFLIKSKIRNEKSA